MNIDDDRTPEQKTTHTWLIVGTDRGMSGWGKAQGGSSVAAWACKPEDSKYVLEWVERRSDMQRVREVSEWGGKRYRPSGKGHCHIYYVDDEHPALSSKRRMGIK